ncbi:MAG: hypothetical protein E7386_03285 [Ruminococcaceae bacterium]|jgi:hypothetical protein|nr:hypothetical protein [Oscillospiraceae bacterium]
MKRFWRKINKGIILLFILVVVAAVWSSVDTARYNSRWESAEAEATAFAADLAEVCKWPKDMPKITSADLERKNDKYMPYLDAGLAKVKPHLFSSKALDKEIKEFAMRYISSFFIDEIKPEQVTFTPQFSKIRVQKDTASAKGVISSKTTTSTGKIINRSFECEIRMEYVNDKWTVVEFLQLQDF